MIMAGGTGGHVFPALAVAEALRARDREVVWLGTRRGLEARLVPPHGIDIEWISIVGLRGRGFWAWLECAVADRVARCSRRSARCAGADRPRCSGWAASSPAPAGSRLGSRGGRS